MKSPPFAYHRAASAAEAAALLAEFGADARILAGGQSLIPLMNLRLASPGCLVDITTAADLDGCGSNGGGLDVGAAARQRSVELHADTLATAPALAEAIANAGQVPVRHQGTVVGSIAHADPSAEMPAAFKAQGGTVRVLDASGSREIASEDFFEGYFTTALAEGELVTGVTLDAWPTGSGHGFLEFSVTAESWPIALAAVLIHVAGGTIDRASVVLGGVAEVPLRRPEAEAILVGAAPGAAAFEAAAEAAAMGIEPLSDSFGSGAYRKKLARVMTRRALTAAAERVGGES
ncbi:MAG: FAD binding domain-containing protein [bacterium]|nr:FAD binding domain-containing protein [bacterium]MDE0669539.1 FAD binding domain-containing protein [bacterium]